MEYNGTKYTYVKNLQGDVIGIIDSYGATVVEYKYDAWGNILSIAGSMASTLGATNPFRYRGYYYDVESGWYYLNSRYYDPQVGRFLNADGIVGANGGITGYNMFAYCGNNPVMHTDSSGYWFFDWEDVTNAWDNLCDAVSDTWDATTEWVSDVWDATVVNVIDAVVKSVEIEIGLGPGIGGGIDNAVDITVYRDAYIRFDDGEIQTGTMVKAEIESGLFTEGIEYDHPAERNGVRDVCTKCGMNGSVFLDIIDCDHSIRVEENDDYCVGIAGSLHFIIGGHARVAFNFSEFWDRLFD